MLTEQQRVLLRYVVDKYLQGEEQLSNRAAEGTLTRDECERICAAIGAEFAEAGTDDLSEPTARGLELEELLDEVNRPNLSLPIRSTS